MRFLPSRPPADERLLWTRDVRFANRLSESLRGLRRLDLDSGIALIAPAGALTDAAAATVARTVHDPDYGLVAVDGRLPESDRYVHALAEAVQVSGLAERIGMNQSTQVVQTKLLDLFFALSRHSVAFQPIVHLGTGERAEWECLFRPEMGHLPATISTIVEAAIETERAQALDSFIVGIVLERLAGLVDAPGFDASRARFAINLTPATLLDPAFDAIDLGDRIRATGLSPRQVTLECTEQQAVRDLDALRRRVAALRRLGFGFAVDDAGAGHASFSVVAALRPSVIKIDREIVHRVGRNDAKQALIEAFVSFARRIGAKLVAEGIETRAELLALRDLGVGFGQGFLLGRPSLEPADTKPAIRRLLAAAAGREPSPDVAASTSPATGAATAG